MFLKCLKKLTLMIYIVYVEYGSVAFKISLISGHTDRHGNLPLLGGFPTFFFINTFKTFWVMH